MEIKKATRVNRGVRVNVENPKEAKINILNELAERNTMSFKEIRDFLTDSKKAIDLIELENTLKELCELKLIDMVNSTYRDFNAYYITAEGLQIVRAMENFEGVKFSIAA